MSSFIAKPFKCADPENEISLGMTVAWFADNLRSEIIQPVLKKRGLENFDPNEWYPTQLLLDIIYEVYYEQNAWDALVAIGKKSAEDYPFAPDVVTFEDAVRAFNEAHHTIHHGIHPDQGFLINKVDENTLIITNNTPWPGDLIFGILFTFGKRFGTRDNNYQVESMPPDEHGRAVFKGITQSTL